MSEDKEKIVGDIDSLAEAIITAYVKYINEHRDTDNASVMTAISLLVAIIVDTFSFEEGDLSQEEALSIIADTVMKMLKHPEIIRDYMKALLMSVVMEGLRQ
jgi:hypothetical protein